MHRFELDDRYFPLLIVLAPPSFDDESFADLFKFFEGAFRRRSRYALVIDTSAVVSVPSAKQRALISAWEKVNVQETRRWNVGVSLVVTSALVRGVLTALTWIVPAETQRSTVATRRESVDWCCEQLVADGVALTASIEELRLRLAKAS